MYSAVITFKDEYPKDALMVLREACEKAFDNRGGKAACHVDAQNRLIFEGDEALYGCLQLGILTLDDIECFKDCLSSWEWIDEEEPDENHCILESLSIPVVR